MNNKTWMRSKFWNKLGTIFIIILTLIIIAASITIYIVFNSWEAAGLFLLFIGGWFLIEVVIPHFSTMNMWEPPLKEEIDTKNKEGDNYE